MAASITTFSMADSPARPPATSTDEKVSAASISTICSSSGDWPVREAMPAFTGERRAPALVLGSPVMSRMSPAWATAFIRASAPAFTSRRARPRSPWMSTVPAGILLTLTLAPSARSTTPERQPMRLRATGMASRVSCGVRPNRPARP